MTDDLAFLDSAIVYCVYVAVDGGNKAYTQFFIEAAMNHCHLQPLDQLILNRVVG